MKLSSITCQHPARGTMPGFTYGISWRDVVFTGYIRTHERRSEDTEDRDDMRFRGVE
jgi:hypothetical protein